MKFFSTISLLLLISSLSLFIAPKFVRADIDEDDVDEIIDDDTINQQQPEEEEEILSSVNSMASPFAKANILFVQPESTDLPAGRLARVLVGFYNNGTSDFIVDSIEGSFRYPQDFSYHIQNFTSYKYNKIVESEKESTFEYFFTPSETFSSRQFGLTINVRYRNDADTLFMNTVFNDTVSIVEPEEGIDGETFFLYIFLAALVVLGLVAAQQFFSVFTKKAKRSVKSTFTSSQKSSNGGVSSGEEFDYEWIPKEHLPKTNKSPQSSPRQRRGLRSDKQTSGNSSNDE